MTDSTNTATRRGVLVALAGTAAFAGTIGAAIAAPSEAATFTGEPTPEGNRLYDEAFGHGFKEGGEIAIYHMARAWIDRWKACGGSFSGGFEQDGHFSVGYYMPESYVWTPTDRGNPDLPPHTWLLDEGHHDGAVKVLNGLLEMVPGLRETVREIVGMQALASAAREA